MVIHAAPPCDVSNYNVAGAKGGLTTHRLLNICAKHKDQVSIKKMIELLRETMENQVCLMPYEADARKQPITTDGEFTEHFYFKSKK